MRSMLVIMSVAVVSCSSGPSVEAENAKYEITAQEGIKQRLRDPSSAQFSNLKVVRRDGKVLGVCGQVNSKNGFGGMSGPTRFIYGGATAIEGDGVMDDENFDGAWQMICS